MKMCIRDRLNREFIYPLMKTEVIRATRSAEKVYLSKDKQYRYKNETLIAVSYTHLDVYKRQLL